MVLKSVLRSLFILFFLLFINSINLRGQTAKTVYLVVQFQEDFPNIANRTTEQNSNNNDEDGSNGEDLVCNYYEYLLTDDFVIINNQTSELNFKSINYDDWLPITSLKAMGIKIDDIGFVPASRYTGWRAYDINGVLVDYGNSERPDFSKLKKNRLYIIVEKENRYKYLHLQ